MKNPNADLTELDYLTPAQAGRLLQVSSRTVTNWAHAGKIEAFICEDTIRIPAKIFPGLIRRNPDTTTQS